jgi:PAS domain S-box-containing protein
MKILHLEDNREDATLVRELLLDEWPGCEIKVVCTRPDFVGELQRPDYEVILSDFNLGSFTGLEALQLTLQHRPEVPFIFLSGTIGEDRAIEAVRSGAHDYVLKDRMKRLVTAIQRAIRENDDQKRRHEAEEAQRRFVAILESTPDFVGLSGINGRVFYVNNAGLGMMGFAPTQDPGLFSVRDFHPAGMASQLNDFYQAAQSHGTWSGENVLQTRDGKLIPVSQVIIAHKGPHGSVEYYSTVMRDITASKRAEAIDKGQRKLMEMMVRGSPLRDTLDALLRFIESLSPDMLCSLLLLDADGSKLRQAAGPSLPEAFARANDSVPVGEGVGSCGTAAFRAKAVVAEDIATDPSWEKGREVALAHGLRACWSTPIFDSHQRVLGTFAIYYRQPGRPTEEQHHLIDVGTRIASICLTRHEAERRIREQADLLNKARDAIVVSDLDGRITFWNQGAERVFGWTAAEAVGRHRHELFGPTVEDQRTDSPENGDDDWRSELRLNHKQGQPLIVDNRVTVIRDAAGQVISHLSICTDITAKKKLEEQFLRAQRMESIGMLAAGIAHDLNNVLAPILMGAPILRDRVSDPGDVKMLTALEKSAERGAGLVRQILGFAHGVSGVPQIVQVKHIIRDLSSVIRETFPKTIRFEEQMTPDLWPIRANATQVHQVLLNLCVNARDAMPKGGTLRLQAENCTLDELAALAIEGARPGAWLMLQVSDTGTGIPPEVLAHIWEPFFTTKEAGKGTGLGLSTVRGIVESHNGFVTLRTEAGRGTTFRVYFPATETADSGASAVSSHPFASRGNGELILLVDDEPNVREITSAILSRHGYRVLVAGDGTEAVALFAPRSNEIHLVITDVNMPYLDGAAVANVVRRINPQVKILAISGMDSGRDSPTRSRAFANAFLLKPFKVDVLLATVSKLLASEAPPA